jgi:hypothetical protein
MITWALSIMINMPAYGIDGRKAGFDIKAPMEIKPATPISVHSPGFAATRRPYLTFTNNY